MSITSKKEQIQSHDTLSRPLLYNDQDTKKLLESHRSLHTNYSVENPYYNFTESGATPYFNQEITPGLMLTIGSIASLTETQMARYINEQTHLYINRKTMGDFPNTPSSFEDLTATMSSGFTRDHIVVLFEKNVDNKIKPVACTLWPFHDSR